MTPLVTVDADNTRNKRRSPSTPSPPSSIKRSKTEYHDTKLNYCTPPPLPLGAPHGVERIPFSATLNPNRLSSQYLEQLTSERIDVLRRQGRRVVGLPVVLNDGIVLNWDRQKSGSVESMRFLTSVGHRTATRFAERRDEKHRIPAISTRGGPGTSTMDAIVIDSDEDACGMLSPSRDEEPRGSPNNRGISSNKDVVDDSDSDIELLSSARSENEGGEGPYHSPLSPSLMPSILPSRRALTKEVALSGFQSDDTDVTTTDTEAGETDEEENGAEDVQGSRHTAPQTIGKSGTKGKRRNNAEREIRPGVSKNQRREACEKTLTITSNEESASDPHLKRVPLPKTDHGRARRLLIPESADLPLVAVTMRGDCHFIERKKKYRISGYSLPNPGVFRHVGDVCIIGNIAVLGCDKGSHQISFLSVTGKPRMIDSAWSPHSSGPRYQDTQKRGVSRLAAIHANSGHIKFLSGGYDGTIHEWTAGVEKLNEPRSSKVVSHGACIMALAYSDRDRSVLASAQRRLHITDLNRSKTMSHLFSNDVQQIHIHPQAAYITLLEVRHLDRQVQLYDSRKGGFNGEPCLSFGHRNTNSKFSGMHTRGSVHLVHFAMASEDGGVLLWDFRNSKKAVIERRLKQAEKVVHAVFADRDIATFGQGVVTFFEDYLAR